MQLMQFANSPERVGLFLELDSVRTHGEEEKEEWTRERGTSSQWRAKIKITASLT